MLVAGGPQVVVQQQPNQKVFTTAWHEQWTGCFDDTDSCLCACFCPCIQFGKNYTVATNATFGQPPAVVASNNCAAAGCACVLYGLGTYFLGPIAFGIMGCLTRGNLRQKYNISTGECADSGSDLLIHCCCPCCALAQEWREANWRADQPMTIAVPGGVIVGTTVPAGTAVVVNQPQVVSAQPVYATQAVQMQPMYAQQPQYSPQPQYVQQQPQYAQQPQYVVQQQPMYVQQQQQPMYR